MALEETAEAVGVVDFAHGDGEARPFARVLCEVGIAGLEEDFYAVEGPDDGFGLWELVSWRCWVGTVLRHTAHPAMPPAMPLLVRYSTLRLSTLVGFVASACSFFGTRASSSVGHSGGCWRFESVMDGDVEEKGFAGICAAAGVVMVVFSGAWAAWPWVRSDMPRSISPKDAPGVEHYTGAVSCGVTKGSRCWGSCVANEIHLIWCRSPKPWALTSYAEERGSREGQAPIQSGELAREGLFSSLQAPDQRQQQT